MATRKVTVASSSSNRAKQYETSATTWGQLKNEISELLTGDLEAIVNPGHVTLSQDNSVLPTGDFKLYLIPTKNKSGAITESQAVGLGKEIGAALVEAANKATTEDVNALKELLISDIEDFFDVELGGADCEECEDTLEEAKALARKR